MMHFGSDSVLEVGAPTFAVVSVKLLRVVDLPDDGLPTRPISGSRGMLPWGMCTVYERCASDQILMRKQCDATW